MKRLSILLLTFALLFSLSACAGTPSASPEPNAQSGDIWVNPHQNDYTLTRLRMVGKGEDSSGYKIAFFPPQHAGRRRRVPCGVQRVRI